MNHLRAAMPPELAAISADLDLAVEVDVLLADIRQLSTRAAIIVELRFFAGFSGEETAVILDIDRRTVDREWSWARAWLRARLNSPA